MTLDDAIEALRAAWPDQGCGVDECCLRRTSDASAGICRCGEVQGQKEAPIRGRMTRGDVYRLVNAARRVVEAPHEPPPSLDEAIAVLVDRAATQAESGTGEVARPLREAVARAAQTQRVVTPWGNGQRVAVEDGRWCARLVLEADGTLRAEVSAPGGPSDIWSKDFGWTSKDEAMGWCDTELRKLDWVLLEQLP